MYRPSAPLRSDPDTLLRQRSEPSAASVCWPRPAARPILLVENLPGARVLHEDGDSSNARDGEVFAAGIVRLIGDGEIVVRDRLGPPDFRILRSGCRNAEQSERQRRGQSELCDGSADHRKELETK